MRLHRFYISEKIGNKRDFVINSADLVNQVSRVFRLKTGDSIIVFDGSGSDYVCKIEGFSKSSISLNVTEASRSRYMPEREVVLFAAVVKKDTFEWIVEKATELGVSRIVPILSERSEKKSLNMERLNKIAVEASEQSGRGDVPKIESIKSLEEALESLERTKIIVFHTDGQKLNGGEKEAGTKDVPQSLAVFIGPEGGWSPEEIDLFHKKEIPIYSLGNQVLRAETAAVATLSKILT